MIRKEDVYCIGRIGKPHGVKGEVSFHFTDDVFDRVEADYLVIETDGILVPFFIEAYRFRTDTTALLKLEGVDTQEAAQELTNRAVFFERRLSDSAEQPSQAEIIGYRLTDHATGRRIGTIEGIDDTTQNVLLEVATDGGRILVPVAEEFIKEINQDKQEIRVELPEGLLEL